MVSMKDFFKNNSPIKTYINIIINIVFVKNSLKKNITVRIMLLFMFIKILY